MASPTTAHHFRDLWIREAAYVRALAAEASISKDQARLLTEAQESIRNAWRR